jgi:hypothetical protein
MVDVRIENANRVIERWNRVFEAVSAEPRRQLVVSLLDADPDDSVSLPEGARNPNVPVDARTLRTQLYHVHLPMLDDWGFVGWETDPLRAFRGPRFDEVAVVFDALHSAATTIPDSLVIGCQRLEQERQNIPEET